MKSARKRIGFAGIGLMLLLGEGRSRAETLHLIALTGQPIPGGGSYSGYNNNLGMSPPALNNRGVVSFAGAIDNAVPSLSGYAIFCAVPGKVAIVARADQSPPALSGSTFSLGKWFSQTAVNDAGVLAFGAQLSPGSLQYGILRSGASPSAMTLHARTGLGGPWEGLLAPSIFREPSLNPAGQTAFVSGLSGTNGGTSNSLAVMRGEAAGGTTLIAQNGDAVPGGGATYALYVKVPALNGAGQVAFLATTSFYGTSMALLRGDGESLTVMLKTGTVVPGLGTVTGFGLAEEVAICDDGDVVLPVGVSRGTSYGGVIRVDGAGATDVIMRVGDPVPNYPGTFRGLDRHVAANRAGLVAFSGSITTNSNTIVTAIFRATSAVVASGDAIPGGGATFLAMDGEPVSINSMGQVAFRARLSDGRSGIFLSDPVDGLRTVALGGQAFCGSSFSKLQFAGTSTINGVLDMDRNGLNDAGEVAFHFDLADGREGIALWSSLPKPNAGPGLIEPVAGGFRVKFPGIPGWSYQVQRDGDLSDPWEDIPTPIQADPAGWVIFDDLGPGLPARRFYRCLDAP